MSIIEVSLWILGYVEAFSSTVISDKLPLYLSTNWKLLEVVVQCDGRFRGQDQQFDKWIESGHQG
jgi:hypothetical protein